MDPSRRHATWVEVDLGAIENNIRQIRALTPAQVMAVVKADGYGHGAVEVGQAALRAGATWCGVARLEEGLELRRAGVQAPILVLSPLPAGRFAEAVAEGLSIAIFSHEQIEAAAGTGRQLGRPAGLHLKLDTGMSRLGARPEQAAELARRAAGAEGARLEGLFTHFARADESDLSSAESQLEVFRQVIEGLQQVGLRPPLVHAANSAATLTLPASHFDLVRPGIAVYGLHPSPQCRLPGGFRPALTWKSLLSQVKRLPPGRGVSYGHAYVTRADELIGTVLVGYADGFRRVPMNQALVRGVRVPVVGRVCMDLCMLQLDAVPEARVGEEVVLVGPQGEVAIPAEEVAGRWGTVNYEVTCGIGARVPRVYR
jgi:alanine racemase